MRNDGMRCQLSAGLEALATQGKTPGLVACHGSSVKGVRPTNRPLEAVAPVQIRSGLRVRNPCMSRVPVRFWMTEPVGVSYAARFRLVVSVRQGRGRG